MTLTQLQYIVALFENRSFSTAAQTCHVSQPTLSMQIQKLEEEVGFEIFDRSQHPVRPTKAGLPLIEQAKVILAEAQKFKGMTTAQLNQVAPKISIGIIPTLSPLCAPKLVSWFSQNHPEVELTLLEKQTEDLLEDLKQGRLDLGIAATPLQDRAIKEVPLFNEPFVLYLNKEHPLLKEKKVKSEMLESQEIWLLSEGHCFREQSLKLCVDRKRRKLAPQANFESGNLETLRRLVDSVGGYTLLPGLIASELSKERQSQQIREFEQPAPSREVSIVHSKLFHQKATLDAVQTALQNKIPDVLIVTDKSRFRRIPVV